MSVPPALPMNWRMTPTPPLLLMVPVSAVMSPAMSRSSVVLPVPLAPTMRDLAPLADAKAHVVEEQVPADRVAQVADVDESHGAGTMSQRASPSGRV